MRRNTFGYRDSIRSINADYLENDPTSFENKMYILKEIEEDGILYNEEKDQLQKMFIF